MRGERFAPSASPLAQRAGDGDDRHGEVVRRASRVRAANEDKTH